MSQDYEPVDLNDDIPDCLTVLDDGLAAAVTLFSGAVEPASPVAFQLWLDTSTTPDSLKMRNAANSAWVVILADVTSAGGGLLPLTGGTMSGSINHGSQRAQAVGNATVTTDAPNVAQIDARVIGLAVYLGTISATSTVTILITVATATDITDVVIASELAVTADAGNKWTFQVQDFTATLNLLSAVKDTSAAAITADTAYALGVNQNNTALAASKVIKLICTKVGSPNNLQDLCVVIKHKVTTL